MLGAIVGDIVGSRFEYANIKSKEFELFVPECMVTDDSIMTLAVAKALMVAGRIDALDGERYQVERYKALLSAMAVKYMQEIGRRYPNCGYGGFFAKWMFNDNPKPYNSFGNGAAMRISPVGFYANSINEVYLLADCITGVTHDHEEGIKGARAAAFAVYMAKQGFKKDEIQEEIEAEFYTLDFTIDQIRDTYHFNETCQETVPQAIKAFLESSSFEDAIRTAISLGGDSDTLAAITGSIAEAYYGIPDDIKQKALEYLDNDLRTIYHDWLGLTQ